MTTIDRTGLRAFRRRASLDKRLEELTSTADRLDAVRDDLLSRPANHDTMRQTLVIAALELTGVVKALFLEVQASKAAKQEKK